MRASQTAVGVREALLEQHRVARLLVGAAPRSDWRPTGHHHLMMVDALERVRAKAAGSTVVDIGLVLDALRIADPAWPWGTHIQLMLDEWDRVEAGLAASRAARRETMQLYGRIRASKAELEARVTDLVAAREAAEGALATLNRTCDLFEDRARDIFKGAA